MSCIRTAWDKAGSGCPSGTPRATNGPFHGVCHLRGRDVRGLLAATGGGVGEVRGHTSERLQPVHMACVRTVGASCQKMPVRRIEDEETSGQAEGWIRRTAGVPDRTCRPRACCRANDPKPENQRATSLKRSHGAAMQVRALALDSSCACVRCNNAVGGPTCYNPPIFSRRLRGRAGACRRVVRCNRHIPL
jgi:hypothetical protein